MALDIVHIYKLFPTQEACIGYLEKIRWNNQPVCPYCGSHNSTRYKNARRHHCNTCNTSYSVTVGTVFHKTKLDFQKWFLAIDRVFYSRKKVSTKQLASELDINKNTSWYVINRLRQALVKEGEFLKKIVESQEMYNGKKPRILKEI